jgi:hypothetical protein
VSADGLEPRLTASCGSTVDFEFRVVQRDPGRRVPYRTTFQVRNVDRAPVTWCVDPAALDAAAHDGVPSVFTWSPQSGTLQPNVRHRR